MLFPLMNSKPPAHAMIEGAIVSYYTGDKRMSVVSGVPPTARTAAITFPLGSLGAAPFSGQIAHSHARQIELGQRSRKPLFSILR